MADADTKIATLEIKLKYLEKQNADMFNELVEEKQLRARVVREVSTKTGPLNGWSNGWGWTNGEKDPAPISLVKASRTYFVEFSPLHF